MKNTFFKINMFLILIFLAFFTSSCSKNWEHKEKTTKIKLSEVTHSVFYAPQYVAIGLNYFKDEGLDVELFSSEGSDKTLMAVLSSQADIGLLGSSSVIHAYNDQGDATILFAGLTQRDGSFLMGRSPNFKWEDLEGKEVIAGRKGGVPKMVLEYILAKKGFVSGKNIKLIDNIPFGLIGAAFARGIGDFATLFEPTASNLALSKDFFILKAIGKECEKTAYTCYCCLKSYYQKHPDIIKKFIKAIYKAQDWVNTHSTPEIVEVIAPFFVDSDKTLITKCVGNYIDANVWCENPLITKEHLETIQEIMIHGNELENKIGFEKIVDQSYAQEILEIQ